MKAWATPLLALMLCTSTADASGDDILPKSLPPGTPVEIVWSPEMKGLGVLPLENPLGSEGAIPMWQAANSVKQNQPRLAEIQARLGDVDVQAKLERMLREMLASSNFPAESRIEIVKEPWSEKEALAKLGSDGGVVLRLTPFVGFDNRFNAMRFDVVVWTVKYRSTSFGGVKAEYGGFGRVYNYGITMPTPSFKQDNAAAWRWKRVSDADLRAMVDEGLRGLAELVAYDLGNPDEPLPKRKQFKWAGWKLNGSVIRDEGGVLWMRDWEGRMVGGRLITELQPDPASEKP